jgi:uncharacterized spore protein YtfJ
MTEEANPKADEGMKPYESRGLDKATDILDKFIAVANVDSAYGQPIQKDDTLIIPTAEVVAGMGFGLGDGGGPQGGGAGGGGGGQSFSRPVAVIIAGPNGVRVEPVVDATKIALAMFTAAGFMAATLMRMLNPKKPRL